VNQCRNRWINSQKFRHCPVKKKRIPHNKTELAGFDILMALRSFEWQQSQPSTSVLFQEMTIVRMSFINNNKIILPTNNCKLTYRQVFTYLIKQSQRAALTLIYFTFISFYYDKIKETRQKNIDVYK
jgi:hypothetical protein